MVLAYCGLDCNECPVYLASIENNAAGQIQLAREYSTDTCKFGREDMHCLGCHSDTVSGKMCGDCKIRICGMKKSYEAYRLSHKRGMVEGCLYYKDFHWTSLILRRRNKIILYRHCRF